MSYQGKGGASAVAVVILCGAAIAAFGLILYEMTRTLTAG